MSKAVWDSEAKTWRVGETLVPNWTPDEVSFKNVMGNLYKESLEKQLGIKSENMLDKDQKKVVVDQLGKRYKELDDCIESWTRQVAMVGKKLKDALEERDSLQKVLENLDPCDCDE